MASPSPAASDSERRQRNQQVLAAYASCPDPDRKLRWRNILVRENLPLVFAIAGRLGPRQGMGFEDLAQFGCLGLIRAVESFDPCRSVSLSSFAVPFVRGAMLHALRDRQALLRIPRDLWELRQRLSSSLERRRSLGLPSQDDGELAAELACSQEQLREVRALASLSAVRSLDAPLGAAGDEPGACLIDQLAAPEPPAAEADAASDGAPSAELSWLRQQLQELDPDLQQLLDGRQRLGCTWVELGRQLGIPARQAQRRHDAALARLQQQADIWRLAQPA
jgi:RNA polymerase sigma-B factor